MSRNLLALAAGLVFGFGLALSHMVDPSKVIAFLDVVGAWDPSLALVMGGALLVTTLAFPLILRRRAPWFDMAFHLPTRSDIDGRLIGGAALFGLGWGLSGYCPGPAVAALAINPNEALLFLAAVIAGGMATRLLEARLVAQPDG